jgi:hypothetical protein
MGAGKLKKWKGDRGFGFIADDAGGRDTAKVRGALLTLEVDTFSAADEVFNDPGLEAVFKLAIKKGAH